eukprot:TRINITY_DN125_c0_g1_i1.p4 TRINITY_DN125_c0_g1~~TRINITY_DN125_c0_g1_i1.p4  ORF type:complete len:56 (-),score=26.34 TRINITY_DN125_c0_g1_i1:2-169(-)
MKAKHIFLQILDDRIYMYIVDLCNKVKHLSFASLKKRKKYRLRGRSSETAKAHRG